MIFPFSPINPIIFIQPSSRVFIFNWRYFLAFSLLAFLAGAFFPLALGRNVKDQRKSKLKHGELFRKIENEMNNCVYTLLDPPVSSSSPLTFYVPTSVYDETLHFSCFLSAVSAPKAPILHLFRIFPFFSLPYILFQFLRGKSEKHLHLNLLVDLKSAT